MSGGGEGMTAMTGRGGRGNGIGEGIGTPIGNGPAEHGDRHATRRHRPWRGWGGVAAMAGACALALTAVLCPLHHHDAAGALPVPEGGGNSAATHARYASAPRDTGCTDATAAASLDPASGSTDGPAVERIKARGRLIVGVDQNSYLWGFRDPATGRLAGFDIDIVRAIAQDILGDPGKVQYLTVPTADRIDAVKDGKVDMVVRTMSINCQREKDVAFSTAYFEAGQQVLAPKKSAITGFDDSLKGKRVCTARGSTGQAELQDESHGASVTLVDNQLDCLVLLQLGRVDAVFTDNALAAGQAAQDPQVHLVGSKVTDEPYGVAMNLGAPDLVRRVNQVLDAYRAGGANSPWMHSYRTWLAAQLPGITGPPQPTYT